MKKLPVLLGAMAAALALGLAVAFLADDDKTQTAADKPNKAIPGLRLPGNAAPVPESIPAAAPLAQDAAAMAPQVDPVAAKTEMATVSAPAAAVPTAPIPPSRPVAAPAAPTVESEDLPGMLDKIRRNSMAAGIAQPVAVDRRVAVGDLATRDGESAISVAVSLPAGRDDAEAAYDALIHGRYQEALTRYRKATISAPANAASMLGLAVAEHKLQMLSKAQEHYRFVLRLDPGNPQALNNLTQIIAGQSPEQALAALRSLQHANPSFGPIAAQIGALEAERGDLTAALTELVRAVQISPDNGLYRLNLAIIQDRAGLPRDAMTNYQTALDLIDPDMALPLPVSQIRNRIRYLEGR